MRFFSLFSSNSFLAEDEIESLRKKKTNCIGKGEKKKKKKKEEEEEQCLCLIVRKQAVETPKEEEEEEKWHRG